MRTTLALLSTFALTLGAMAADWPQFLGPTRDGVSTEKGLTTDWPKGGPPKAWEFPAGEGYSGPVVAEGKVILFHRVKDEEVVQCLDADKGTPLWKFAYPTDYTDRFGKGNGSRATPLVAGGKVYTLGAGGVLTCVELKKGEKVWQVALHKEYKVPISFFGVATSPVLEGDHLLVNVGGKDAGIVAFHKDTGREVWKATSQEASYSSPVVATLAGARQAVFFTREGLVLLDPATGKVNHTKRWRARINESVNAAVPLVVGDEVFLTTSYNTGAILLRVTKDSLEEVWKEDESLSAHFNTPVVRDGILYGIDGRQEAGGRLRCVEWKTGKVRWTKEGFGCASVTLVGDRLWMLTEGGELVVAEATPEGYREKTRAAVLQATVRAHPAFSGGRLYARDDKKLVCFKLVP